MVNVNFNEMSYDELQTHVSEAIVALRQRSYYEGLKQGKFDASIESKIASNPFIPKKLTRDEIIEKAKRDVAELSTTWRPGCPSLNFRPSAFDPASETVNFSINREKGTVVCYITYLSPVSERTHTSFRGIAKVDPSDCFNVHIGKAIALRRALGLEVPAEYLNAPQPTEVRVGDVVQWKTCGNSIYKVEKIERPYYDLRNMQNTKLFENCYYEKITNAAEIIDDSRDE